MKRVLFSFACSVILCLLLCVGVSAQEYSSQYPAGASYNSGSPAWIHCNVNGLGEILIVLDAKTDLQSFGFDSPYGYNLINNTGSTIVGRVYVAGTSNSYACRFQSFYRLQIQTGTTSSGQYSYVDYEIQSIIGTSLDLIDYVGFRSNDAFRYNVDDSRFNLIVVSCLVCVVLLIVIGIVFKSRLFRM